MLIGVSRRDKRPQKRDSRKRFSQRPISYILEAIVCFGLVGAFLQGFYSYARTADPFSIRTIRVEGADELRDEDVIARSGITSADNLPFLDTDAVRERVKSMSFVHACTVTRVFPDKVIIRIEERAPVATLLVNNRLFEVDFNGYVLRETGMAEPHVGPFITNASGIGYVEPGQQVTDPAARAALEVWRAFRKTSMAPDVTVSEISAEQENRIVMYCDELDFEIRWGRGDYDTEAWKLDVLWKDQRRQLACKEYVDLRFGNDVACR